MLLEQHAASSCGGALPCQHRQLPKISIVTAVVLAFVSCIAVLPGICNSGMKVPWLIVAQLEAAHVGGLRIISPAVLRPLLRNTARQAEQQARSQQHHHRHRRHYSEHDPPQPLAPQPAHPYSSLSTTQALQLLEYCCSDLTTADEPPATRSHSGSTGGSGQDVAAAGTNGGTAGSTSDQRGGTAAAAAAAAAGPSEQQLPPGLPQGAANMVAEVFGPAGLAALGGLANQLQQRLTVGVDDVMNAVMEVMAQPAAAAGAGTAAAGAAAAAGQPQRQAQQQQQRGGAAAVGRAGAQVEQHVGLAAAIGRSSNDGGSTNDGNNSSGSSSSCPVNMVKVSYLKGLPIPTASGTVAVLGSPVLFVYPDGCTPPPTALLPAHLLRQFVAPECVAALAWLFKLPEVRQQLKLAYYSTARLAEHLGEALAPTWTFAAADMASAAAIAAPAATAASSSSGSSRSDLRVGSTAGPRPGSPGFPALIPWDDGAAGGPYCSWLVKLWQVLLHLIAAAPEWEHTGTASSSGTTPLHAAGSAVAGNLRNAAQRARGLVDVLAAEVAVMLDPNAAPGQQVAAGSAAVAAGGAPVTAADAMAEEAARLWQPLLDWPLLPLADGRLLKLRYRELALAVLPDYRQRRPQTVGAAVQFGDGRGTGGHRVDEGLGISVECRAAFSAFCLSPTCGCYIVGHSATLQLAWVCILHSIHTQISPCTLLGHGSAWGSRRMTLPNREARPSMCPSKGCVWMVLGCGGMPAVSGMTVIPLGCAFVWIGRVLLSLSPAHGWLHCTPAPMLPCCRMLVCRTPGPGCCCLCVHAASRCWTLASTSSLTPPQPPQQLPQTKQLQPGQQLLP